MKTVTLHIDGETAINVFNEDGDHLIAVLKASPAGRPTFYACKPTNVEASIGHMRIVEEERDPKGRLQQMHLTLDAY